jgi:hypothetical protein
VNAILEVFPQCDSIITSRMYHEQKEHYNQVVFDMDTGELLHAQGVMGWTMSKKYLDSLPTHENFRENTSKLSKDAIFDNYATTEERKERKKEQKIDSVNFDDVFNKIALAGGTETLNDIEKEWLQRYNTENNG